jgi:hypothetical protein
VASAASATACSSASADTPPAIVVAHIRTPISEPVWSARTHAIYALARDGSVVSRVVPATAATRTPRWRQAWSTPLDDLGRNLEADAAGDDNLYVPRPDAGRVTVIDDRTLRPVAGFPAGGGPSYVSTDSGSDHLLVLDADGSTVTPVDLHTRVAMPARSVEATSGSVVEGATRGRRIDFYVAGTSGIAHYKWTFGGIRVDGRLPIPASEAVGDKVKTSRLYVAVDGTDRLIAVDLGRGGTGLRTVAATGLDGPIVALATGEDRLYAATDSRLYVFASDSFSGFDGGRFRILEVVDFASALHRAAGGAAAVNGLTVGDRRAYLTIADRPLIISIAEPPL